MYSLSIASSWFNVQKMGFDWKSTLKNWVAFMGYQGEIVICINTSEDDSFNLVTQYANSLTSPGRDVVIRVIAVDVPYTDPAFDGKAKALAVSNCTGSYVMLLDCDEILVPTQKDLWLGLGRDLEMNLLIDAFLVPVVDLIGDKAHFKGVGQKWYLTRNKSNITRGVHKQAFREDGSFDKTKSDSCDAIYADTREVIRARPIISLDLPPFITISYLESGQVPFVIHLGYLNLEQRVRQSAFWAPVWDQRDGGHSKEPATTLADLEKIPRYTHNLPPWDLYE